MPYFIIIFAYLLLSVPAHAADRTVTIRGVVDWGTLTSGIGGLGPYYFFPTNSDVSNDVFSVCNFLDDCELTGVVNENDFLISVSSIRKIDTETEPSSEILTDAACWALSIREKIASKSLCIDPVYISNFHEYIYANEKFFEYDFKVIGFECGTYIPTEIGSGKVHMAKRRGTWFYFK